MSRRREIPKEVRGGFKVGQDVSFVVGTRAQFGSIDEFHETDGGKVWVRIDDGERLAIHVNQLTSSS